MTNASEKEIGGKGRIFLRLVGFELEAEGSLAMRLKKTAGQSPDQPAIDDQSDIIEGEIVEDVDPAEVEGLKKL